MIIIIEDLPPQVIIECSGFPPALQQVQSFSSKFSRSEFLTSTLIVLSFLFHLLGLSSHCQGIFRHCLGLKEEQQSSYLAAHLLARSSSLIPDLTCNDVTTHNAMMSQCNDVIMHCNTRQWAFAPRTFSGRSSPFLEGSHQRHSSSVSWRWWWSSRSSSRSS